MSIRWPLTALIKWPLLWLPYIGTFFMWKNISLNTDHLRNLASGDFIKHPQNFRRLLIGWKKICFGNEHMMVYASFDGRWLAPMHVDESRIDDIDDVHLLSNWTNIIVFTILLVVISKAIYFLIRNTIILTW